ncbi:hypothetical protein K437DRAFT_113526 [Tilletiaria anomala UBC 951]|uniref:Uncharacterized protein n=1 Tax=Tilletiaria anomala (strain ATCC 24038 / CBS 436.72 / UBC 951) TaxID=1037660 RepID=A0A066W4B0_TILAU|nr:uncharacterized protein K437DRAFT_113526 [Tilletiaria anomala UBC 951]KDN45894.1 hypothetical protein K437DRAFT_113526 [Tilletiaria anomala UBC 951]
MSVSLVRSEWLKRGANKILSIGAQLTFIAIYGYLKSRRIVDALISSLGSVTRFDIIDLEPSIWLQPRAEFVTQPAPEQKNHHAQFINAFLTLMMSVLWFRFGTQDA